jgi:large subunit ribosomal protein L25
VLARAGGSTPISITVAGETGNHLAFAREIQWDPIRDNVLHVDLLVADAGRPVSAQVPIILNGESPGARTVGGTVMQQLRQLDVEALPLEMPSQAEIDLAILNEPDSVVRVSDISLPGNVTVLTDPEDVVVRIELPRVETVEEEGVEDEAEAAGGTGPSAEEEQA